MTRQISPAHNNRDEAFLIFAKECQAIVDDGRNVQERVAAVTEAFCRNWRMPDPRYMQLQPDAPYASYLLYMSPREDLSIVLDIFMSGQAAVVHNHLCWGVFACLEGEEMERLYKVPEDYSAPPKEVESRLRPPGVVTLASAEHNAFHQVECARCDRSVSLHVYGRDIGRIERLRWDENQKQYKTFIGGYSNKPMSLPNYATFPL